MPEHPGADGSSGEGGREGKRSDAGSDGEEGGWCLQEKMSAAAAPRKPKKGAVSSPLKVEPAMGSRRPGKRGEDGRGQAQATMIQPLLVAGARSDSLALLSLALSVDSSNRQREKKSNNTICSWAHGLIFRSFFWARLVGCVFVPGLRDRTERLVVR